MTKREIDEKMLITQLEDTEKMLNQAAIERNEYARENKELNEKLDDTADEVIELKQKIEAMQEELDDLEMVKESAFKLAELYEKRVPIPEMTGYEFEIVSDAFTWST